MNKTASKALWIYFGAIVVLLVIIGAVYYFLSNRSVSSGSTRILENPASGLSLEEAVREFNESFVLYLLYSINANELHNPVFSSDQPKIEIFVENDLYSAIVEKGNIKVEKGEIKNEDIKIMTSKEEAVKMMNDRNYITTSFKEGNS